MTQDQNNMGGSSQGRDNKTGKNAQKGSQDRSMNKGNINTQGGNTTTGAGATQSGKGTQGQEDSPS